MPNATASLHGVFLWPVAVYDRMVGVFTMAMPVVATQHGFRIRVCSRRWRAFESVLQVVSACVYKHVGLCTSVVHSAFLAPPREGNVSAWREVAGHSVLHNALLRSGVQPKRPTTWTTCCSALFYLCPSTTVFVNCAEEGSVAGGRVPGVGQG